MTRPNIALSDLSVTEFLTLSRAGFLPHGLVVGTSVFDAGWAGGSSSSTGEITSLSKAMHDARNHAVGRMREQAKKHHAEGVVGVRLQVEHHVWRGGHTVAKFIALGTAIAFDHEHAPQEFSGSPSLRLAGGEPFTSDLSGQDFVTLLRAGFRPIALAMGNCAIAIDTGYARSYAQSWQNEEIAAYTQAFFDARETAMERLSQDLFKHWKPGTVDCPVGVVGMTVDEQVHGGQSVSMFQPVVVEYTAIGTAVAPVSAEDKRKAAQYPAPNIVVPLDR